MQGSRYKVQGSRIKDQGPVCRVHSASGFTLLEVMIAMAILAIALVAVFQSQSQSLSLQNQSKFSTTAALLAQGKMAELEAADPRDVRSGSGDFGDEFPDYAWEVDVNDSEMSALKRIELVVKHTRMSVNNVYRIVFYKYSAV